MWKTQEEKILFWKNIDRFMVLLGGLSVSLFLLITILSIPAFGIINNPSFRFFGWVQLGCLYTVFVCFVYLALRGRLGVGG